MPLVKTKIPIMMPTFYKYENDKNTFNENDEFLLGEYLLVASVVNQGERKRKIYLPKGNAWYNYNTNEIFEGGKEIIVDADLNTFPLMIKEGAIIPINTTDYTFESKDKDERGFVVYAHDIEGETTYVSFEDDGETQEYKKGKYANIKVTLKTTKTSVEIKIEPSGDSQFIQENYNIEVIDNRERAIKIIRN